MGYVSTDAVCHAMVWKRGAISTNTVHRLLMLSLYSHILGGVNVYVLLVIIHMVMYSHSIGNAKREEGFVA